MQVSPLNKGLGAMTDTMSVDALVAQQWNLLREDLSLPTAVLYESRLRHNLDWMQRFVSAYKVKLAPHGKTTMAPKLFQRQLDGGAWAITLATAPQTLAAYTHGVRRVLMANQLVGKRNMEIVADLLDDPMFEFFCVVDSATNIDALGAYFGNRGKKLQVFIEIGAKGGRAGVRDTSQLEEVLSAVERWSKSISLCGIELFEGVFKEEEAVRSFLDTAVEIARSIAEQGRFTRTPAILTGAGSSWFDVVADVFCGADIGYPTEVVLRPGCYLTHDVGAYLSAQERRRAHNEVVRELGEGLIPALHLWAYVQAIPTANLAIVGLGKRDASFDSGLPVPALQFRQGWSKPVSPPSSWTVTKLMDQHAFLEFESGADLAIGDMIAFNICHPCLTFDKWRHICVVSDTYDVIDVVETFF